MFDILVASDLCFLPIHLIQGGKVEKEGIIWPTHITRRPDSDFKRRLIKALTKPVAPKEYYRLFETVTIRTPLMKLRQVRSETKSYPAEEMGKSYLEHYPGTVLQRLLTVSMFLLPSHTIYILVDENIPINFSYDVLYCSCLCDCITAINVQFCPLLVTTLLLSMIFKHFVCLFFFGASYIV